MGNAALDGGASLDGNFPFVPSIPSIPFLPFFPIFPILPIVSTLLKLS